MAHSNIMLNNIVYKWTFNDVYIDTNDSFILINYTTYNSVLEGGVYRCYISVLDPSLEAVSEDTIILFAPVFTTQPSSLGISVTNTVEFSCTAFGYPTPTIQWRRINNTEDVSSLEDIDDLSVDLPLNFYNISYSGYVNETSTLMIYPVDYQDFGYYICIATLSSSNIIFVSDCCSSNDSSNSTIKDYNTISNIATLTGTYLSIIEFSIINLSLDSFSRRKCNHNPR